MEQPHSPATAHDHYTPPPPALATPPHYCARQYNKPCLKYINLAHNSANVHPEGDTGVIDFLFLECFYLDC